MHIFTSILISFSVTSKTQVCVSRHMPFLFLSDCVMCKVTCWWPRGTWWFYYYLFIIFSKWFKCSVLGPRWWWWSRHRIVSHAALCMWNRICCQCAGLSHERSKQTKPFSFPSIRLIVKEYESVIPFPQVVRRRHFSLRCQENFRA